MSEPTQKKFTEENARALILAVREWETARDTLLDLQRAAESIKACPAAWRVEFIPDVSVMAEHGLHDDAKKWAYGSVETSCGLIPIIAEAIVAQTAAEKAAKERLARMEAGNFDEQ